MFTLPSEKIAENISNITNSKEDKSSDSKVNVSNNLLESNFKESLNSLIQKAQDETNILDYEEAKDSKVVITFKSLSNEKDELNKAIIFNLFFYIKNNFEDEFNFQIHNASYSINSTLAEKIVKEETKEEEKKGIQRTGSKIEENKNVLNINNNKICSNIYRITENLNKEIQIKEENSFETHYQSLAGDEDSIINSSIKEFAKTLEKMKSAFSTSKSITLQQSLDLYLEGKKGEILEKNLSIVNLKDMIDECSKNLSSNNELKEIEKFCEEFERNLNKDYNFLNKFLKLIIVKIGEVEQNFNIKSLLDKYDIKEPVDLLDSFSIIKESLYESNCPEELYYLCYVISYFLVISNIKALNKVKDEFDKIGLNKLIENNITKENLISIYMKEVNIPGEEILNQDIWKHIQNCKEFVEDPDMNESIFNYAKNKSKNDFKNELFSLLEPHVKNINLDGKDPQNIFLDSFMKENNLK